MLRDSVLNLSPLVGIFFNAELKVIWGHRDRTDFIDRVENLYTSLRALEPNRIELDSTNKTEFMPDGIGVFIDLKTGTVFKEGTNRGLVGNLQLFPKDDGNYTHIHNDQF